ncbi:hypothetical protein R9C00_26705 [Flammeovirgaceae bacterium SG7u.111]|nr:hypothetical protein [Flammeovirgaceae bacterium SG7u.132]WPO35290.1 hypothetical protein R9C00_26705 [Flammeovirgaceae bacterium SG7u.111]
MFYVLIVLIPFLSVMAYLIDQNKKLKNRYEQIEKVLGKVQQKAQLEHIEFPMGINRDLIVTNNSIKRLESFIMKLEEELSIKKSLVVSNTYSPKLQKLKVLEKRAKKIQSVAVEEPAEQMMN